MNNFSDNVISKQNALFLKNNPQKRNYTGGGIFKSKLRFFLEKHF